MHYMEYDCDYEDNYYKGTALNLLLVTDFYQTWNYTLK